MNMGDLDGAEAVHRRIVSAWRTKPDRRPQARADALQNLAVVLEEQGELDEAETVLVEARDLYDSFLASDHYRRAFPRLTLASVRLAREEYGAAEDAARQAVEILEERLPESSYVTATARCRVGRALAGQNRLGEARALLQDAVEVLAGTPQPSIRYELECRRGLRDLYRVSGQNGLASAQERAIRSLQGESASH